MRTKTTRRKSQRKITRVERVPEVKEVREATSKVIEQFGTTLRRLAKQ